EDVLLQRVEVEGLELFRVVEVLTHGVGQGRVLVENLQVHLIRPPVPIRPVPSRVRIGEYWVLAFTAAFSHVGPSPLSLIPSDRSLLFTLVAMDSCRCLALGVRLQPPEAGAAATYWVDQTH